MISTAGLRRPTLLELAEVRLEALCSSLGLAVERSKILEYMHLVLGPHADHETEEGPRFRSDVCDDHTPFEFSISLDRQHAELRVLMETVGEFPSLASTQAASVAMTDALAQRLGLCVDRLRLVEDIFVDDSPCGLFARWHALEFRAGRSPSVKIYLNPQIRGPQRAAETMGLALTRLARGDAWQEVQRRACRGPDDELKYFSLDLDAGPNARVKVYVRHHRIDCSSLERYFAGTHDYQAGSATAFCRAMMGTDEPFCGKPVFTCLAWVDDSSIPKPTVYAPIAGYVQDDAEARERILAFLTSQGLPADRYATALDAFAMRSLDAGAGMQSYVSLRWDASAPRMTIYLSPQAYRLGATNLP